MTHPRQAVNIGHMRLLAADYGSLQSTLVTRRKC